MKVFKIILLVVVSIIGVLLIAAIFIKKEYTVKREIVINKPSEAIFAYVKQLKNHNEFNKWMRVDPATRKTYTGTDGTTGFTMAWESESSQVGKGEQEISRIEEGREIDYNIRFKEPFEAGASASIGTAPISAEQTKVTWGFNSSMKYPMNAMMIFMDI
ncbi:MAG: SRPBCC family protein, partial [Ferruginibacter sp.]|nr:SRPBCC family protein [Ferruginibacter sp.]